jgi:Holliday junction resolvase RusA-like endonuclease
MSKTFQEWKREQDEAGLWSEYEFTFPIRVKPAVRMTQRSKWVNEQAIEYRENKEILRGMIVEKMNENGWPKIPERTPFYVMVIYRVTNRLHNHDIDNVMKSIMDACKGAVYPDDRWCDSLEIERYGGKENTVKILIGTRV